MASYGDVIRRIWSENTLFSVLIELTYRCNLNCFFCYNDLALDGKPMSKAQYFALLDELRAMGTMNITLSGGEPLAHPDFFEIGARARELGFVVRVKSNGHALRGRLAQRLKEEVDPFVVEISLHGATAATHDRQTQVPGSFERLLGNIPLLQSLGLRLRLNSTLTLWNEEEVEAMYAIADGFGLPLNFNTTVSPRDDGDREPVSIGPSREGMYRLFSLQEARAQQARQAQGQAARRAPSAAPAAPPQDKNCGAASSGIAIDPYGNVLPCVQWRQPVGNLHQDTIERIWTRSAGVEEARRVTVAAKSMVDAEGPDGALMGYCPGLAHTESGDPLKMYSSARVQMDVRRKVKSREQGGLGERGP